MRAVVDGLMLGDGSLAMHGKVSARLTVGRQYAHKGYNLWLMETLSGLDWGPEWEHVSRSTIDGRKIEGRQHRIRTRNSRWLKEVYDDWYLNGKQVPWDFELCPISLAIWYMDDGSLWVGKDANGYPTSKVNFYTNSFNDSSIEWLRGELEDQYDVKSSIQPNRKGKVIVVGGNRSVRNLMDVIRPTVSQVECMKYKLADV